MADSSLRMLVPAFERNSVATPHYNETRAHPPETNIQAASVLLPPMQITVSDLPRCDAKGSPQETQSFRREASWRSQENSSSICDAKGSQATQSFRRETSWESQDKLDAVKVVGEATTPRAILPQLKSLTPVNFHVSSESQLTIVSDSTSGSRRKLLPSICDNLSSARLPEPNQAPLLQRFSSLVTSSSEVLPVQPVTARRENRPRSTYWSTVMMESSSPPRRQFSGRPSVIEGNLKKKLLLRPALSIVKNEATPPPRKTGNLRHGVEAVSIERETSHEASPVTSLRLSRTSSPELEKTGPMLNGGNESPAAITVKAFTCRGCKVRFETRTDLASHSRSCALNTSKRPFLCSHCGASFHKNSNLAKHIALVELKLRPFKCTLCDATFGQKSNLSSHIRVTHHGERRYVCSEPNCGRRFGQNSGLRAHVRTVHLGARDFICECDRRFGSRGDLNRHIRSAHQKLLPFPCLTCGKAFSRKSVLQRHRSAVHGEDVSSPQK